MSRVLLIAVFLWLLTCPRLFAQVASGGNASADLSRLQAVLKQKREEALKPIDAWYEKQLESGLKQATKAGNFEAATSFRDELAKIRGNVKQSLDDDFEKALLASSWSWTHQPSDKGVQMTFQIRPTVSHVGMSGTWEITGRREVTIFERGGDRFVLEFDERVTSYRRKDGVVFGRRWQ